MLTHVNVEGKYAFVKNSKPDSFVVFSWAGQLVPGSVRNNLQVDQQLLEVLADREVPSIQVVPYCHDLL